MVSSLQHFQLKFYTLLIPLHATCPSISSRFVRSLSYFAKSTIYETPDCVICPHRPVTSCLLYIYTFFSGLSPRTQLCSSRTVRDQDSSL